MQNGIDFESWYEDFNRFAGDLYPGRYTRDAVKDLVEVGRQVNQAAKEKKLADRRAQLSIPRAAGSGAGK